jgi:hypothetical protein
MFSSTAAGLEYRVLAHVVGSNRYTMPISYYMKLRLNKEFEFKVVQLTAAPILIFFLKTFKAPKLTINHRIYSNNRYRSGSQ